MSGIIGAIHHLRRLYLFYYSCMYSTKKYALFECRTIEILL